MSKHIVCLTFDFDTQSGFIARGMTTPTALSRGEFGLIGARRILSLLKACGLRATWFIPGFTIESHPASCAEVVRDGHEVAHHSWAHVPPAQQTRAEEEADLVRANDAIAALTGRKARGYRSPSWDLSPNTIELLLSHGFLYDSSLMGHDYQLYRCRTGDVIELERPAVFGPETDLVEMPISWSTDDYPHFEYMRMPNMLAPGLNWAGGVLENWYDDFDYMTRIGDSGVLTYTCHPFVIGRGHRMLMLERLIEKLKSRGAVFRTMESVALDWLKNAPAKR